MALCRAKRRYDKKILGPDGVRAVGDSIGVDVGGSVCGRRAMSWTPLEIIVPILMYCAMLWWVGRGFSWTQRLTVGAVTLAFILVVILFERGGF